MQIHGIIWVWIDLEMRQVQDVTVQKTSTQTPIVIGCGCSLRGVSDCPQRLASAVANYNIPVGLEVKVVRALVGGPAADITSIRRPECLAAPRVVPDEIPVRLIYDR